MRILKKMMPKSFYRMLSKHRTWIRSLEEDRRLKKDHSAQLQQIHVSNTRIVPTRQEFLENMPKGKICVEVGVAEGEFSRQILDIMKPKKLYLIDLWSSDSERYSESMDLAISRVQSEIDSGIVEVKRGWSWEMMETLEDNSVDWVYIDASHEFDDVCRDLEVANRKINRAGIIAGHDYTRWSSQGINRWGVVEAVNELCIDHDWYIQHLTSETHGHLSFSLKAIENQQASSSK